MQIVHNISTPDRPQTQLVRRLGAGPAGVFVLNGHARAWGAAAGGGDFSLKWAPRGQVLYRIDGDRHRLAGDRLLLTNPGQPYETTFVDPAGSESFCLFFSADLVREAWAAFDDPQQASAPAEFPNLVFQPGPELTRGLRSLRHRLSGDPSPDHVETELCLILADAVSAARTHRARGARLPALKPSTRRHLLSRLETARRLLDDGEIGDLDAIAAMSGVSKFHLVRLFRAVMGVTPMSYASGLRLDRAAERLRASTTSIDEVAFAAGYESASAFARAFRRRISLAPAAFRASTRN